jgi:Holliday junction resolvasome RuvABC endonuclease subunit
MSKQPPKILGLNPGSRYLALAILRGSDLRYWGIKVLKGTRSKGKVEKTREILSDLIDRYDLNVLAVKKLHRSRSSRNLNLLTARTREFARRKGLRVYEYSLRDLERFFSPEGKINKKQMAELVASQYPFLFPPLEREKRNRAPYFIRTFEAIALAIRCFDQLDNP